MENNAPKNPIENTTAKLDNRYFIEDDAWDFLNFNDKLGEDKIKFKRYLTGVVMPLEGEPR